MPQLMYNAESDQDEKVSKGSRRERIGPNHMIHVMGVHIQITWIKDSPNEEAHGVI